MKTGVPPRGGLRGILTDDPRIAIWIHVAVALMTVAAVWRYLNGHGFGDRAPVILVLAGLLLSIYAASAVVARRDSPTASTAWCLTVVTTWLALVILAPSFSWVAVPLAFVTLRVIRFALATAVIAVMVVAVAIAWTTMVGDFDPTIIVGPACIAGLAVLTYRVLDRESTARQVLLDDLQQAQGELADAQHDAGVLAERARLSRDIHDSVAQGLTSINLLLQAADKQWSTSPASAHENIGQAARTARDSLDEVRRVVHDLAPPDLTDNSGDTLETALCRTSNEVSHNSGIAVTVLVHGEPTAVASEISAALLRSARGALANVVEHSAATEANVSLTYQPDSVSLDVRDNGTGFDPTSIKPNDTRGSGLTGIKSRAESLGGAVAIESAPHEGTVLAVCLPTQISR